MKLKHLLIILLNVCWASGYAQTNFSTEAGVYAKLLNDLKSNLYQEARIKKVQLDNEESLIN